MAVAIGPINVVVKDPSQLSDLCQFFLDRLVGTGQENDWKFLENRLDSVMDLCSREGNSKIFCYSLDEDVIHQSGDWLFGIAIVKTVCWNWDSVFL